MDSRFSLSLKQILILIAVVVVLSAAFAVGVFALGMRSALGLVQQGEALATEKGTLASSQGGPTNQGGPVSPLGTLPRAMTATPRIKTPRPYVLNESDALKLAQDQAANANLGAPITVQAVSFITGTATLTGQIDYMGYKGQVEISGEPYASGQRLHFKVTGVMLEGQALSADFYPSIEAEVDKLFEQIFTGYDILSVQVEVGKMTLIVLSW